MVLVYPPGGLPSLEQHCGRSVASVAICDGEQLLCPDVSGMQMDEIYQPKALAGLRLFGKECSNGYFHEMGT